MTQYNPSFEAFEYWMKSCSIIFEQANSTNMHNNNNSTFIVQTYWPYNDVFAAIMVTIFMFAIGRAIQCLHPNRYLNTNAIIKLMSLVSTFVYGKIAFDYQSNTFWVFCLIALLFWSMFIGNIDDNDRIHTHRIHLFGWILFLFAHLNVLGSEFSMVTCTVGAICAIASAALMWCGYKYALPNN